MNPTATTETTPAPAGAPAPASSASATPPAASSAAPSAPTLTAPPKREGDKDPRLELLELIPSEHRVHAGQLLAKVVALATGTNEPPVPPSPFAAEARATTTAERQTAGDGPRRMFTREHSKPWSL